MRHVGGDGDGVPAGVVSAVRALRTEVVAATERGEVVVVKAG